MSLTLRPSTDADIPAITAIYAHAVQHGTASFELDPPDEAEMLRRRGRHPGGRLSLFRRRARRRVLGYAYAGAYRTRPAYRSTVEDSIYVALHRPGTGRSAACFSKRSSRMRDAGFPAHGRRYRR